jgi:ATP-dependent Clp protease, protease subunit
MTAEGHGSAAPGSPSPPRRRLPPDWPGPGQQPAPRWPDQPPSRPPDPLVAPTQAWLDRREWQRLYDRLLERRIVMAHGHLDGEAATRLCAQLLTLDAEGDDPIRLELHGLSAELDAALTVMDVLGVVGVPVHAYAGGQLSGPALGVLACCSHRRAYPNAVLELTEPRADFEGTAAELAAHEEQLLIMLDALYFRLADVTGREVDEIRADAKRRRVLTADQAVSYGLVHGLAEARRGG